ncbi:MAG: hypothetical protein ACI9WU_005516, partial [Myxococcota bacterium]
MITALLVAAATLLLSAPPTYEIAGGKSTVTMLSRGEAYMGR